MQAAVAEDSGLRIGMVSRLSGVPAPTIRMWERRYRALTPARSPAGGRRYTREDAARLALLKQLIERGHAIGTIAGLTDQRLHERLADPLAPPSPRSEIRLAVVGEGLVERLAQAAAEHPQIRWKWGGARIADLAGAVGPGEVEVLVAEIPLLSAELANALVALRAQLVPRLLIVVYAFAAGRDLQQLDGANVLLLRSPVDSAQLIRISRLIVEAGADSGAVEFDRLVAQVPPAARFSAEDLGSLAVASSALRCECPRQVSALLTSLGAFERYSVQCENADAEDAAVHRMLGRATAQARALLEEALGRVLAYEARRAGA